MTNRLALEPWFLVRQKTMIELQLKEVELVSGGNAALSFAVTGMLMDKFGPWSMGIGTAAGFVISLPIMNLQSAFSGGKFFFHCLLGSAVSYGVREYMVKDNEFFAWTWSEPASEL